MKARGWTVFWAAAVLGACGGSGFRWSQWVEPSRFDGIPFATPEDHARFHALRRCFAEATRGRGFRRIAGRLDERYGICACRSGDEALCGGGDDRRSRPSAEWYEVQTQPIVARPRRI